MEMLSLMAKEEHLKQQQGKEKSKGRDAAKISEVAEAAKREARSSISQGVEDGKESKRYSRCRVVRTK